MGCGASADPDGGPPSPIVVTVKPNSDPNSTPPITSTAAVEPDANTQPSSPSKSGEENEELNEQQQKMLTRTKLEEKRETLQVITDSEITKAAGVLTAAQTALAEASPEDKERQSVAVAKAAEELEQVKQLQQQVLVGLDKEIADHKLQEDEPAVVDSRSMASCNELVASRKSSPAHINTAKPDMGAQLGQHSLTPRIAKLTTEVSVPESVIRNLANISSKAIGLAAGWEDSGLADQGGADFLLQFLEAASTFSAAKSTDDRVSYMFKRWDLDQDGLLGAADLQAALECDEGTAGSLMLEMGGTEQGLTVEAFVAYVKANPTLEEQLILRTHGDRGIASQLASRPLVVMVLLRAMGQRQKGTGLESFVKVLDIFAAGAPLTRKLERVFDALDIDCSGTLTREEVAKMSHECAPGDETEAMMKRLTCWIDEQDASESDEASVSRDDFLQFASQQIPGVEEALTVHFQAVEANPL